LIDKALPTPYAIETGQVVRDRDTILAIWQGNLGESARMRTKFDWFYAACPFGEPSLSLLRHVPDDRHVGVAAAGPRRLSDAGLERSAGVLVDLAVDAEHRSLGPAMMLQMALAERAGARFDLLYGFPNPKAAPVFKRVGYSRLGDIVRHARVLRHRKYLARSMPGPLAAVAGAFLDAAVRAGGAWRSRRDPRWRVEWSGAADTRFDALWSRSDVSGCVLAVRDLRFAQWRFDRCPLEKTRYLLLIDPRDDSLAAWFACQERESALHVRDFWSARAAEGIDRAHVDALLREARKDGHTSVSMEVAGRGHLVSGWLAAGFQPRGQRPVYGKWTAERAAGAPDLYLTSADEDE
jgi:hypothetical protein